MKVVLYSLRLDLSPSNFLVQSLIKERNKILGIIMVLDLVLSRCMWWLKVVFKPLKHAIKVTKRLLQDPTCILSDKTPRPKTFLRDKIKPQVKLNQEELNLTVSNLQWDKALIKLRRKRPLKSNLSLKMPTRQSKNSKELNRRANLRINLSIRKLSSKHYNRKSSFQNWGSSRKIEMHFTIKLRQRNVKS